MYKFQLSTKMRNCFLSLLLVGGLAAAQAQTIVPPTVKTKTTFAIVVDSKSYAEARSEIEAYRAAVERDGLGTYLLVDDWKRPEPIREQLIRWHADRKAPLEGCVLVGDVPIPMVRDAHHLSSAFKMSPKANWQKSSVPSDRYYDDFGLRFDYLKQDSLKPSYHYFSLRADSRQYIAPDIYSARILPLNLPSEDRYAQLRRFLQKATAAKAVPNVLDQLSMARGHGYNSEDRVAWSGEQLALREQLPGLFRAGSTVRFLDFDTRHPMKPLFLAEVQREGLDVMLFHHHGGPTMQYVSGYEAGSDVQLSIRNVKTFLRNKVARYAEKHGREAAIEEYAKRYDVPRSWCEEAFDAKKIKADSIETRMMDIYTDDIREIKPNARFVLFDACYNGSFHQDDNVAGAYIFGQGNTVATMGCTVNTIQDKWPDEFLGLLSAGMRVGQFTRFTCFLENHLIGDPTYRFADTTGQKSDLNHLLVLEEGHAAYWRKQAGHALPDMRAMALRQLSMADEAGLPDLLKQTYRESDSFVTRLEALRLLVLNHPGEAAEVVAQALNDPYELVRRFAVEYTGLMGDPSLMPALAACWLSNGAAPRLRFRLLEALEAFDAESMAAEIERQAAARPDVEAAGVASLSRRLRTRAQSRDKDLAQLSSRELTEKKLVRELSIYRNRPIAAAVQPLLSALRDESRSVEVRRTAAETLGWYTLFHAKADIVAALRTFHAENEELNLEVEKTIHRLEGKNR